jgi:membrane dipeptidase
MPKTPRWLAALAAVATLSFTAACSTPPPPAAEAQTEEALVERARGIHERVITLDTHVDINAANFTAERSYADRLETQVNLPKMEEGGLDAAFFIVYVGQGPLTPDGYAKAYAQAIEKFDAIHRLTTDIAPDRIELARTAADVRRIAASGKLVALIGIENGYPIGTDLGRVQEFYDRGGRYLSLAHNGHNQLSDSNTGEQTDDWVHRGLSDLGRQVIGEMNRLGIMVDVSHPSRDAILQMAEISKAPIMASHSSVRALADHMRNMDDEVMQALAKTGGVMQITALGAFVKVPPPPTPERVAALDALRQEFGITGGGPGAMASLSEDRRAEFRERMAQLDQDVPPPPRPTVQDFVDHIDYAVRLIGIDHVGISSDFDGGGGVIGWDDASETFNVTLELVRRGYTEEQIGQLWSGNLLRVMEEVERVAREIQGGT